MFSHSPIIICYCRNILVHIIHCSYIRVNEICSYYACLWYGLLQHKEEEISEEGGGVSRAGYLFLMEKSKFRLAKVRIGRSTKQCCIVDFHKGLVSETK